MRLHSLVLGQRPGWVYQNTVVYADDITLISCGNTLVSAPHDLQLLLKSVYDLADMSLYI